MQRSASKGIDVMYYLSCVVSSHFHRPIHHEMKSKTHTLSLILLLTTLIMSCDNRPEHDQNVNQLYITEKGDSVETGPWIFEPGRSGVSKRGNFKDGFRDGIWKYKHKGDSTAVNWIVFAKDSIKLNLPAHVKFTEQEIPVLFLARLRDDSDHSYYTLLRYNLKEVDASVYDYIFQYIQSLENSSVEKLVKREVKKFNFKKTEVFRVKVDLRGQRNYQAISYIFTSRDVLYDLTFREELGKVTEIDLEVFSDMLYSFQASDFDPFSFNNKSFTSEENVDVRTPIQN